MPTFESAWAKLSQECHEELEMYKTIYKTASEQNDDECSYGCRREVRTFLNALRYQGVITCGERRVIMDYILGKDGE